ncbi:MAG: Crp/Fnr family transcriptional regulator, partial [Bacteroidetes bacterium]|nr:Crp/Fnr family transcriptional regulator [Bacteroidota bacterium]
MEKSISMETKQVNSLCDFPVFKSQNDLTLCSFLSSKKQIDLKKGEILFLEKDDYKGVYFICSGLLKIYHTKSKKHEFILGLGQKWDIIGIDSIISNNPYPHSVKVVNDAKAYFLSPEEMLELFGTNTDLRFGFLKEVCANIKKIENRITSIVNKRIKGQLAEILLVSSDYENNYTAGVKLSIQDISKLIGTTQNYIYKIISDFTENKLI